MIYFLKINIFHEIFKLFLINHGKGMFIKQQSIIETIVIERMIIDYWVNN